MEEERREVCLNGEEEEVVIKDEDKVALQFMDSLHNYLSLSDSLSSTLRQGWLELASARYSMGTSRVNSSLLDLKFHSAATILKITENEDGTQPHFTLQKWVSSEHELESTKLEYKNEQPQDSNSIKSSGTVFFSQYQILLCLLFLIFLLCFATITENLMGLADNDEVQKERHKSLSVFGVLISPKLRATQLSFEKALETLIEIANLRSSLLHSFSQLNQEVEDTKE
ncbi:hypothetical protein MTR_3g115650 [Medicago truncatula]|uniref:Vacuolar ATPase assembly protein VMA22 n=1 Tax=Medicago truncatula TaxID=3880 RepID=A0A072VDW6_MEDTR|nr:hypothetical protein MTR_3g115650 [Medicago truncatula]